jgi:hypothetical protein
LFSFGADLHWDDFIQTTNLLENGVKIIYSADSGAGLKDTFFEPPENQPVICYIDEVTSLGHKAGEKKNPEIVDCIIELADSHRISRVLARQAPLGYWRIKMSNKSNQPDASKRPGNLPKSSKVGVAKEDKGAAVRLAEVQNGGNVLVSSNKFEEATAKARKKINEGSGALNSDQASHR